MQRCMEISGQHEPQNNGDHRSKICLQVEPGLPSPIYNTIDDMYVKTILWDADHISSYR